MAEKSSQFNLNPSDPRNLMNPEQDNYLENHIAHYNNIIVNW